MGGIDMQGIWVKARMVLNLLKPQLDTTPVPVTVFNQAGAYIDTLTMRVGDPTYFGLLFNRSIMVQGEWRLVTAQRRMTQQDGWIVTVYMPIDLPADPHWPGWVDWEAFTEYVNANGGTL
jgi:hypothetical protein